MDVITAQPETRLYAGDSPYVGPRPFEREEENCFFGRDREKDDLVCTIIANRASLLFATSGAGKTSLLKAAVIPQLERDGFDVLPVARVRGDLPKDVALGDIKNIYVFHAILSWLDPDEPAGAYVGMTLAQFLEARPLKYEEQEEGEPDPAALPRVVIFDQFEELFTSYPDRWDEREGFFVQLEEALGIEQRQRQKRISKGPPLHVLLAMREDYIASLSPFVEHLPERLRNRYHLEPMTKEAAAQAITRPSALFNRHFSPEAVHFLTSELSEIKAEDAEGKLVTVPGRFVEPVQLQVVCDSLWRRLPDDVVEITLAEVEKLGNVNTALRRFYEDAIKTACAETTVKEGALRSFFEHELITTSGTRGTVFRGQEETGKIPNLIIDRLEQLHIIRAESRSGGRWYELTHDRLIAPIKESNHKWQLETAKGKVASLNREKTEVAQQLEVEKDKVVSLDRVNAELERKKIGMLRIGLVVSGLLFATAAVGWWNSNDKRHKLNEALSNYAIKDAESKASILQYKNSEINRKLDQSITQVEGNDSAAAYPFVLQAMKSSIDLNSQQASGQRDESRLRYSQQAIEQEAEYRLRFASLTSQLPALTQLLVVPREPRVGGYALSEDGKTAITFDRSNVASESKNGAISTLFLWNLAAKELTPTVLRYQGHLKEATLSPDGQQLFAATSEGLYWSPVNKPKWQAITTADERQSKVLTALAQGGLISSYDGMMLAFVPEPKNGNIQLWRFTDGRWHEDGEIDQTGRDEASLPQISSGRIVWLEKRDADWSASVKFPEGEKPVKLFNGKDLEGWEGDTGEGGTPEYFTVKDGIIIAHNNKENAPKVSNYLLTKKKYRNFRLVFEGKVPAEFRMHSGVALWGKKHNPDNTEPNSHKGLLVVFPNSWGFQDLSRNENIYEDKEELAKKADNGDWNKMEILARGDRIRLAVNGHLVADWHDPQPDLFGEGPLGLQLDSNLGIAQEVQFRGLIVSENPKDEMATVGKNRNVKVMLREKERHWVPEALLLEEILYGTRGSRSDSPVTFVTLSQDGRSLLTVDNGRQGRVYTSSDSSSGGKFSKPTPLIMPDIPAHASFSKDGHSLAVGCQSGYAYIWTTNVNAYGRFEMKETRERHTSWVMRVSWSSGGRYLTTSGRDKMVRVWDASNGSPMSPPLHQECSGPLAVLSDDGRYVTSAAVADKHVSFRRWDLSRGGDPLLPITQTGVALFHGQLTQRGKYLLTFGRRDGEKRAGILGIWEVDADSFTPMRVLQMEQPPWLAEISPDGERIVTVHGDPQGAATQLSLWNKDGKPTLLRHSGRTIRHIALGHNGEKLAVAYVDAQGHAAVDCWDLASWNRKSQQEKSAPLPARQVKDTSEATRVTFIGDKFLVAAVDVKSAINTRGEAHIWMFDQNRKLSRRGVVRHDDGAITHLGSHLGPTGQFLVTCSTDDSACVWSLADIKDIDPNKPGADPNKELFKIQHTADVAYADFSADGKYLASAGYDGKVKVASLESKHTVASLPHKGPVSSLAFQDVGKIGATLLITASLDSHIRLFSVKKDEIHEKETAVHNLGELYMPQPVVGVFAGPEPGEIRAVAFRGEALGMSRNRDRSYFSGSASRPLPMFLGRWHLGDWRLAPGRSKEDSLEDLRVFGQLLAAVPISLTSSNAATFAGEDSGATVSQQQLIDSWKTLGSRLAAPLEDYDERWEWKQAVDSQSRGAWSAAERHWTKISESSDGLKDDAQQRLETVRRENVSQRRYEAEDYARRKKWKEAIDLFRVAYQDAKKEPVIVDLDSARIGYEFAICLKMQYLSENKKDTPPEFQRVCEELLSVAESNLDYRQGNDVAWLPALDKGALSSWDRPFDLATKATKAEPNNRGYKNTLAGVLVRRGDYQQAIETIGAQAGAPVGSVPDIYSDCGDWLVLALAHRGLGDEENLKKSKDYVKQVNEARAKEAKNLASRGFSDMTWSTNAEIELLLAELAE